MTLQARAKRCPPNGSELRVLSDQRQIRGFVDAGFGGVMPILARFGPAGARGPLAFADADHFVGSAYLSDEMGVSGDARSRELTVSLRTALRG